MGKLALYGALAGAGEAIENSAKDRAAAAAAEIDDAREMRLESLRQRNELEKINEEASLRAQAGERKQTQEQRFNVEQNDLQRAHEIRLEEMRQTAAKDAANLRNSTKTTKSPWKISSTKRAVTGPDGFTEEPVTTITNERTGATYEQNGNMFVPQGIDVSKMPKPKDRQKAEQWIVQNPENVDVFVETYGYLPAAFFRDSEMMTTRTSQPPE